MARKSNKNIEINNPIDFDFHSDHRELNKELKAAGISIRYDTKKRTRGKRNG